jgi:hypothetical protein
MKMTEEQMLAAKVAWDESAKILNFLLFENLTTVMQEQVFAIYMAGFQKGAQK